MTAPLKLDLILFMKTATTISLMIIFSLISLSAFAESYRVQRKESSKSKSSILIDINEVENQPAKILRKLPYYIVEGPGTDNNTIYI